MAMLKIAVCDDEEIYCEIAVNLLKKYEELRQIDFDISFFESADTYQKSCQSGQEADILLLDIEMEQPMDGICLKEYLCAKKSDTKILFTTNHMEAMQEAFGENVCGFLTKPVSEEKLFYYLDKICSDASRGKVISVGKNEDIHTVKLQDILWIRSDGPYSWIMTKEGEGFSGKGLTEWEAELEFLKFFRIHKSCLVNLRHVSRVGEKVILDNGEELAIARRRKTELKEAYKQFLISQVW